MLLTAPVLLSLLSIFMHQSIKKGSLSRNSAIGLRTKATLSSDQAWKDGHVAANPYLAAVVIVGAVAVVTSVVLPFAIGVQDGKYPPGLIAAPAIGLFLQVIVLVVATTKANSAARST